MQLSHTRSAARAIVLVAAITAAIRIVQACERAIVPFQIDYAEGTVLASAMRLLAGLPLYPPLGGFPYVLTPYGPVGYVLIAGAMKLLGQSLVVPRLFILACAILAALTIAGATRALGGSRAVGVVFAAAFFCSPIVWVWLPLLRVDLLAVLLSLAGIWAFAGGRPVVAALFFVAAVFTKQTSVAAPLACGLTLVADRRWRGLGTLAMWTVGPGMVVLTALGPAAYHHLVSTHSDAFDPARYLHNLATVAGGAFVLLLACGYGLAGGHHTRQGRLAFIYLVTCSVMTLTAGKAGAETNHFIEWSAALALAGAVSMSDALAQQDGGARLILAAVVGVTLLATVGVWWWPRRDIDVDGCRNAYAAIQQSPAGPILSEDVSVLLLAGKDVTVTDPFAYRQVQGTSWARGGLAHLVATGYFDRIVAGAGSFDPGHLPSRWSPEVGREVRRHYRPVESFSCSPALGVMYERHESEPPEAAR